MRRRSFPLVLTLIVAPLALSTPAFAEGTFASSMKGWLPGVETRAWDQKDSRDKVPTKFAAKQCDYDTGGVNVSSINMELNRNGFWTPDEHYGEKRVKCSPKSVVHKATWRDKGALGLGNFDLTLTRIDGQRVSTKGKLNATYVKVTY